MSVVASKRLESNQDFKLGIDSEQFLVWILEFATNQKCVPKKYFYTIGQSLINDATQINDLIFMANKCDLFDQKESLRRKQLQFNAKLKLQAVLRKMSILYKILPIKQKKVIYFIDKLYNLIRQISNWQKSDIKRIQEKFKER